MAQTDSGSTTDGHPVSKSRELRVFLFTTLLLIPGCTVAFVGAYGLAVWVMQMIFGPPGPPAAG